MIQTFVANSDTTHSPASSRWNAWTRNRRGSSSQTSRTSSPPAPISPIPTSPWSPADRCRSPHRWSVGSVRQWRRSTPLGRCRRVYGCRRKLRELRALVRCEWVASQEGSPRRCTSLSPDKQRNVRLRVWGFLKLKTETSIFVSGWRLWNIYASNIITIRMRIFASWIDFF